VEYDLWYTSGDLKALDFITNMRNYNKRLGKRVLFTPHMAVWLCRHCTEVDANCLKVGNNIYCAPPVRSPTVIGSTALSLGLEEICIYNIASELNQPEAWWDYMKYVSDCRTNNFAPECIDSAKKSAGIDRAKLDACKSRAKHIFKKQYDDLRSSNVPYNPAIVVNNHVYRVFLPCIMRIGNLERG